VQLPFARPVTLIKRFGEAGESRQTVLCSIQDRRGYFEPTAPVETGDVVEAARPGGGIQHLHVGRVRTGAPGPGLEHLEVLWRSGARAGPAPAQRLCLQKLHPEVVAAAGAAFGAGRHQDAVSRAFEALSRRVRSLAQLDLRGEALMSSAFDEATPRLRHPGPAGPRDVAEQRRLKLLMMGAAVLPRSVEDAQCALEQLGLASYLMRQLDGVEPTRGRSD
jgi:hypothetical protein